LWFTSCPKLPILCGFVSLAAVIFKPRLHPPLIAEKYSDVS
jgi:hypothetical protein